MYSVQARSSISDLAMQAHTLTDDGDLADRATCCLVVGNGADKGRRNVMRQQSSSMPAEPIVPRNSDDFTAILAAKQLLLKIEESNGRRC